VSAPPTPALEALAARLETLIDAGNVDGCVELLLGEVESARLALGESPWLVEQWQRRAALRFGDELELRRALAATVATWATMAPGSPRATTRVLMALEPDVRCAEVLCDVIERRWAKSPRVRDPLVTRIHTLSNCWRLSCRLEARGIGPPADDDAAAMRFVMSAGREQEPSISLVEALRTQPKSHRHVWRWFAIPFGSASLAAHDRGKDSHLPRILWRDPHDEPWADALVAIAGEDKAFRARLLQALVEGLGVCSPESTQWLCGLHAKLAPRPEEESSLGEAYARQLGVANPAAQKLAWARVALLLRTGALTPEQFRSASAGVLNARSKKYWLSILRAMSKAPKGGRGTDGGAVALACEALRHEAVEVQSAAVDVLQTRGDIADAVLVTRLRAEAGYLSASSRQRLLAWLDEGTASAASAPEGPTSPEPAPFEIDGALARASAVAPRWRGVAGIDEALEAMRRGRAGIPALLLAPLSVPRLAQPVIPIEHLDELIDASLAAIEGGKGADELERIVDGIARLCRLRPPEFETRAAPLRHRALERATSPVLGWPVMAYSGQDSLVDLCAVIYAWLCGEGERPTAWTAEFRGKVEAAAAEALGPSRRLVTSATLFLSKRLTLVSQRAFRGNAEPLLSTPTHAGCFVDPRVLVQRVRSSPEGTDPYDRRVALLRLAPEHRREALDQAADLRGEMGAALRYALGGADPIGPSGSLWYAAARARAPLDDDPALDERHPGGGPAAGRAARYSVDAGSFPDRDAAMYSPDRGNHRGPVVVEPAMPSDVTDERIPTVSHNHGGFYLLGRAGNWERSLWPLCAAPTFAREARMLSLYLESTGIYWQGDWDPLFDPDAPLGVPGALQLALGLAARHSSFSKLAEDALVATVEEGRLDGPMLGDAMGTVLKGDGHPSCVGSSHCEQSPR
jgi:hypothetical protein